MMSPQIGKLVGEGQGDVTDRGQCSMEPATNLRVLSWKQHTGKGAVEGFLSEKAVKVASQLFFLVGKKTMIRTLKKKTWEK